MKKSTIVLASLVTAVLGVGIVATVANPAYAEISTVDSAKTLINNNDNLSADEFSETISMIINFILALLGILCVGVVIFGGIKYSTSQGDPQKVSSATKTILFGIVGLIVALLAYAIVNFVLNNILSS